MRYLVLFGCFLLFACDCAPQPPEVVVIVPPEPIPEPQVLPPADEPPAKIIGNFHGVPIAEQGPWTTQLPKREGRFTARNIHRESHTALIGRGSYGYEAGPGTLQGVGVLTVADQPTASPRLRVELQVKSGRVRVFVKYLGDIYFTRDVEPGQAQVLEGAGIPGRGMSLTVWFEALDGTAQLESVKVTSLR